MAHVELSVGVTVVSKKQTVTLKVAETEVQGKVLVTSCQKRWHRYW
jgi:hypothetical protein